MRQVLSLFYDAVWDVLSHQPILHVGSCLLSIVHFSSTGKCVCLFLNILAYLLWRKNLHSTAYFLTTTTYVALWSRSRTTRDMLGHQIGLCRYIVSWVCYELHSGFCLSKPCLLQTVARWSSYITYRQQGVFFLIEARCISISKMCLI
jgi:hypothetical protein